MVINKYLAELVGTFILVFFGSMSVLAAAATEGPVMTIVPFGFGLGLLAAIFAVGHVSGGHFNPAVTLAMWLDKRTTTSDLIGYWIGQIVGGSSPRRWCWSWLTRAAVQSTINRHTSSGSGLLLEGVLTLVFVMVILASTRKAPAVAGIVIPLTLVAVHLAGIPFSGASVNPARSFGPALIGGRLRRVLDLRGRPVGRCRHRVGLLAHVRRRRRARLSRFSEHRNSTREGRLSPESGAPNSIRFRLPAERLPDTERGQEKVMPNLVMSMTGSTSMPSGPTRITATGRP